MTKVITRFAPAPTGALHIGGARTALFNWLYARRTGGIMRLRIEDTDKQRESSAAIDAIIDGLAWLGLDYDGDVFYQSSAATRHSEVAQALLDSGRAYYCYDTPLSGAAEVGSAPVVRIKIDRDQDIVIDDMVQGRVVFKGSNLDDFVILRSDGTPTYMLAAVVDDHDMGITHIIRGDDHLTNAARQKQIYDAMNWDLPVMAHVPLIHGPDGAKLSKRHGALGVDAYRHMGYLPNAILNYLARLGWSHGNDEIFSKEQMIQWFDPADINRSPARLDFAKLDHINAHYIHHAHDEHLIDAISTLIDSAPFDTPTNSIKSKWHCHKTQAQVLSIMPSLKERSRNVCDLIKGIQFIVTVRPVAFDQKAASLLSVDLILSQLLPFLEGISSAEWSQELENKIRQYGHDHDLSIGKIAQPLRASLTGSTVSIGVFDIMKVLGKDECIARIQDAITLALSGLTNNSNSKQHHD